MTELVDRSYAEKVAQEVIKLKQEICDLRDEIAEIKVGKQRRKQEKSAHTVQNVEYQLLQFQSLILYTIRTA